MQNQAIQNKPGCSFLTLLFGQRQSAITVDLELAERAGVAEGSASLGVAPGGFRNTSLGPQQHTLNLWGPGLKAHTFWAWSQRHIPFFSSARHTGSIAFPHVCVWRLRGDLRSLHGGLPSFPGLIKQKLATVCATLPTAWAHSRLSSCHCHGYFYSSLWEPRI